MLVSGSSDLLIKLWNVNDKTLIRTLTGHTNEVLNINIYLIFFY
jgi:WD40 repeat protein